MAAAHANQEGFNFIIMIIIDAKCKKCRRANQKLFLKGERCFGPKCAMTRRPYAPGVHGKAFRRRSSEYGQQLAEKQKVRYVYGVSETQFKNYFKEIAKKRKGDKEELLIRRLESRLDNVVFRLGWTSSRRAARQAVSHGHILVNKRKVNIPSYRVKLGDVIQIKEKSRKSKIFENLKTLLKKYDAPGWLLLNKEKIEGKVKNMPDIGDVDKVGEISKIIEFYSR
ncbi:MAG: 30S ribosomal protein S4 [Patescibacteria group bacterium]|nr:30S ribosomal protein S4 [Patescibacteria group bacterium]